MRDIPISRIMTANPATVGPDEPATAAKALLKSGDIHHLPVVENGKLTGIVSSSDFLKFYLLDGGAAALLDEDATVRQIMASDPAVLSFDVSLLDAATKLAIGGYHALPVIEPDRTLVGIVTTSDLVDHLIKQIPRGDGSIRPEPKSESAYQLSESEIAAALQQAQQSVEGGGETSNVSQVLLYYHKRNRLLKNACLAAEYYIRSGHAEHEHSILIRRLADVQRSRDRVLL